jgi:acyl transferase domain-containing protein/thioesterase domain-containing protein
MTHPADSLGKIAVVGMAARFPGSRTIEQFWSNLKNGRECISFFTDDELLESGISAELLSRPDYVKAAGVYEGTYLFDASFFGYAPRDAELLDPQHRVFLECAWEALEDAGYDPYACPERIGVFAGCGPTGYLRELLAMPEIWRYADKFSLPTYGEKDFLATRVGYKMNLRGPCITVQTACSTSLVGIAMACQNLLSFTCDMAMAGGVTLSLREKGGYIYKEGGIGSPDGHCRTFDSEALGTVGGSGCGIVVLKRLEDALATGDTIHAVVLGLGLNNDGSARVGFAAPGVEGQVAVSSDAIAMAGIDPETIGYVECHGTATPMGDPIEVAALSKAFRAYTQKKNYCAIGSVKTNIGHVDTAAGVAGFIKAVLALKYKMIPGSLNFRQPNPAIDLENSPFFVNTRLRDWPAGVEPRRAAVSSFGLGGTNAHVILEEALEHAGSRSSRPYQLLVLSARSASALEQATTNLLSHLDGHPQRSVTDAAYTLQTGRHQFPYRRVLVRAAGPAAVQANDAEKGLTVFREKQPGPIAFLFPGQGPQYVNMGRALYSSEPVFRNYVDLCANILKPTLELDIRDVLYPDEAGAATAATILDQIKYTTPILFTIEYSLARLWLEWGLKPDGMIGHSTGEYAAACVAEVFSLEDALRLVCARGRLMQQQPGGAMTAVLLSEQDLLPLLESAGSLSVAAINGPSTCVVSGPYPAMSHLESILDGRETPYRRLHISHASHSKMMDPILEDFRREVQKATLHAPRIPYLSNITGGWIKAEEAMAPEYWVRHVRQPVRFSDGVSKLLKNPERILIEIGPGHMLGSLVAQHPEKGPGHVVLPSLPHPKNDTQGDLEILLTSLGQLWLEGVPINWRAFHGNEKRLKISLPAYPFERQHYQLTPLAAATRPASEEQNGFQHSGSPLNGHRGFQEQSSPSASRHTRPELPVPYAEPRSQLEQAIASLWEEVLGIHGIGVHDKFMALGGHSLLAIQLVGRIRNLLGIALPVKAFYRSPTIAGVARTGIELLIEELGSESLEQILESLGPLDSFQKGHDHTASNELNGFPGLMERLLVLPPERINALASGIKRSSSGPSHKNAADTCQPLVPIRTIGDKPPLFLLHPVGGGVQPYFQLAEYLDRAQPVYAIQNHEFGSHVEHSYCSIEEMAARYVESLQTVHPRGRFCLAGWSMGGILAFEMALQLSEKGETPEHLIMLDAPARFISTSEQEDPTQEFARSLALLGSIWSHQKHKPFTLGRDHLERMDPERQMDCFIQVIKGDGIVAPEMDDRALRAAVKTFMNNNRACERYVPRMYSGPMTVIRASETQQETKQQTDLVFDDPTFGWQAFCGQPVTVRQVPGDHMFMMLEPHVQSLATMLQECIDNPQTRGAGNEDHTTAKCSEQHASTQS